MNDLCQVCGKEMQETEDFNEPGADVVEVYNPDPNKIMSILVHAGCADKAQLEVV